MLRRVHLGPALVLLLALTMNGQSPGQDLGVPGLQGLQSMEQLSKALKGTDEQQKRKAIQWLEFLGRGKHVPVAELIGDERQL